MINILLTLLSLAHAKVVEELTPESYSEFKKNNELAVITFYAAWW